MTLERRVLLSAILWGYRVDSPAVRAVRLTALEAYLIALEAYLIALEAYAEFLREAVVVRDCGADCYCRHLSKPVGQKGSENALAISSPEVSPVLAEASCAQGVPWCWFTTDSR